MAGVRKYLGELRPAATMIFRGLADPRMKIEIEVTARKSSEPRFCVCGFAFICG